MTKSRGIRAGKCNGITNGSFPKEPLAQIPITYVFFEPIMTSIPAIAKRIKQEGNGKTVLSVSEGIGIIINKNRDQKLVLQKRYVPLVRTLVGLIEGGETLRRALEDLGERLLSTKDIEHEAKLECILEVMALRDAYVSGEHDDTKRQIAFFLEGSLVRMYLQEVRLDCDAVKKRSKRERTDVQFSRPPVQFDKAGSSMLAIQTDAHGDGKS